MVERDGVVVGGGDAPLIHDESDACEMRKMNFPAQSCGIGIGD